jgi:hypothetical protein
MFASHLHLIVYSLAVVLLGSLLYCIVTLVGPILFPTIIRYPWPKQSQQGARDKNITVALAGSFNPPHKGHLAMILYLAERYVALFSSLPRSDHFLLGQPRPCKLWSLDTASNVVSFALSIAVIRE